MWGTRRGGCGCVCARLLTWEDLPRILESSRSSYKLIISLRSVDTIVFVLFLSYLGDIDIASLFQVKSINLWHNPDQYLWYLDQAKF
ncbi:hypothetical protein VN97_g9086 [Penicillium thymicola]|uniref:Uncharacterized protein n=1 Tax=Penicillium thymicola TaxID=293382 RepID=A0AAI9TC41_PENTH|nr:hypothetical protein VN97_g9086 [Penicillium thymicola]